jgi:hypothetical protein
MGALLALAATVAWQSTNYNVERHMGTCKVIKLSRAEETVEGMEEMKEALRATDLLLDAANAPV